jgi:hypothetical protein
VVRDQDEELERRLPKLWKKFGELGRGNQIWPEDVVYIGYVTQVGFNRSRMFGLYRDQFRVSPGESKQMLSQSRVEIARGTKGQIQRTLDKFTEAGATVEVVPEKAPEAK